MYSSIAEQRLSDVDIGVCTREGEEICVTSVRTVHNLCNDMFGGHPNS